MSTEKLALNSLLLTAYDQLLASEKPRELPCTYDSAEMEYRQSVLETIKAFDALDLLNANPKLMDQYVQNVNTIRQAVAEAICGSMAFQGYADKFWNSLYDGRQYEVLESVFTQTLAFAQELDKMGRVAIYNGSAGKSFTVGTAAEAWEQYQDGNIDTETLLSTFDKMTYWLVCYPVYFYVPREKKVEYIQRETAVNNMSATLSSYIEGNPSRFYEECETQRRARAPLASL